MGTFPFFLHAIPPSIFPLTGIPWSPPSLPALVLQLLKHYMIGTDEIKEGKGVLSPTAIPCRKNTELSFFRMGTSFTFDF